MHILYLSIFVNIKLFLYVCCAEINNMIIHTVKNPANPTRSTERNGILFNHIVVSACLWVGFLIHYYHAGTTNTGREIAPTTS